MFSSSSCWGWDRSLVSFAPADPLRASLIWSQTSFFLMVALFFSLFSSSKLSWGCIRAVGIWWMKSSLSLHAHTKTRLLGKSSYVRDWNMFTAVTWLPRNLFTCRWAVIRIFSYPLSHFRSKVGMYWILNILHDSAAWAQLKLAVCWCVTIYKQPTV